MVGFGFGPKETVNSISDQLRSQSMRTSETVSLPNRLSKDKNPYHKKAMRNSSELAEPRRLPTASFGLVKNQEIEFATQVVDSCLEFGVRGAQAT